VKYYYFAPFFLLFILLCACQADMDSTPTAVVEELSVSDVVTGETAADTTSATAEFIEPTAVATETATFPPTSTATVPHTPSPLTESETSNSRSTVTATIQPIQTHKPTPSAILPSGETVQFPDVTGIGTLVPISKQPITADLLEQLTEVGRWGKGWVYDAAYTLDGSQMFVLTEQGVYLHDAATATQQSFYPDNQPYNQLILSHDGNTLILSTGDYPYYIELRDAHSFAFLHAFFPFVDEKAPIAEVLIDQTGQYLFVREGRYIRAGSYVDAQVVVWDLTTNEQVTTLPAVGGFDFSPEANLAVTNDNEGQLHLWQWQDQTFMEMNSIPIPEDFYGGNLLAISPSGRYVALSQDIPGSQIGVWQTNDGELLHTVDSSRRGRTSQMHNDKTILAKPALVSGPGRDFPAQLLFSPDSQSLAATSGYYDLTVWQATDGAVIQKLTQVGDQMLFHPVENRVAAWRYAISQWLLDDGSFFNVQNQQIGPITDLALIPHTNQLAIASSDGFIYVRALQNGDLFTSLRAGLGNETSLSSPSVRDIDVTADGQTLVSASNDAYRVWDLANDHMTSLLTTPRTDIGASHMTISYDGKYIYGAEFDTNVKLWIDQEKDPLYPNIFSPSAILFSPNSYMFATTENFGSALVLMWPESEETVSLETFGEDDWLENFAFSEDGSFLAGTLQNDAILVWDILSNQPQILFRGESNSVSGYGSTAAFSPDNQIVAQSAKHYVRFWDMNSGELLFNLNTSVHVRAMTFTPDGEYLITGHDDGAVRFWAIP